MGVLLSWPASHPVVSAPLRRSPKLGKCLTSSETARVDPGPCGEKRRCSLAKLRQKALDHARCASPAHLLWCWLSPISISSNSIRVGRYLRNWPSRKNLVSVPRNLFVVARVGHVKPLGGTDTQTMEIRPVRSGQKEMELKCDLDTAYACTSEGKFAFSLSKIIDLYCRG